MSKVSLFSGINYTNSKLGLDAGMHDLPKEWIRTVTSVKLAKDVRLVLFDDKTPSNSIELDENTPDLSVLRWGNRAVRVNVQDLSQMQSENFDNECRPCGHCESCNSYNSCRRGGNSSSILFLMMLLIGVIIGVMVSKLITKEGVAAK